MMMLATADLQPLMDFWYWVFCIAMTAFALLVLIIIPLGGRDLFRLLRDLAAHDPANHTPTDDPGDKQSHF